MLRWFLADLRTGRRILDLQVLSGTWQVVLNQPDTLRAVVDLQDTRNIALNLRNTSAVSKTILAVADGDRILAAGIVWTRRSLADGRTLELGARGVWSYYDHRYVLPLAAASLPVTAFTIPDPADNTKTIPNPAITTAFINLSIGTIAKKVVQQAHTWTGGSLPIVFMADEAGIHERTYLGPEMKNIGTVLKQLTAVEDGVDIAFRPRFTADRLGVEFLLLTGTNAQPFIASSTEVIWDMAVPQPAASGLEVFEDGSRLAGLGWATGGRSAGVALVSRSSDPTLVTNGYPLFETLDSSHSTVQEQDTLDAWAEAVVARGLTPLEQITFDAVPTRAPFLTNYNVGDYARVVLPPYSDPDQPIRLLRTNYATNPSAETSLGLSAAQRTNLANRPYGVFPSNNGVTVPIVADSTFVRRPGTTSSRSNVSGAGIGVSGGQVLSVYNVGTQSGAVNVNPPVSVGQSLRFSAYVSANFETTRVSVGYGYFDATQTAIAGASGTVAVPANVVSGQWSRIEYQLPAAPATAAFVRISVIILRPTGELTTATDSGWIQDVLVELTSVTLPYFDGGEGDRGDGYNTAYTGTALASTSVLRGYASSGWTSVSGATVTRTTLEARTGSASIRMDTQGVTPNEGGLYSVVRATAIGDVASGGIWVKAPAGAALFALLRLTSNTPLDKRVDFDGTGDWQFVKVEGFAANAASTTMQVMIRTRTAQQITFYLDNVLMELAPTAGAYFDGSSRSNLDYVYAWSGGSDASVSTQSAAVVPGRKRGHPYFLEGGNFPLRIVALGGDEKNEKVAVTAMPRGEEWDG